MIELKQLSKNYVVSAAREVQALQNVNLQVKSGEIFGILGKSGAGKSTLLRCVNLLERPSQGQVIVNGVELTALSASQLREQRRKIGMIFQHFNLLESRTAFENIALPLELIGKSKQAIEQRVTDLLRLVHLEEHRDHYPAQLSGGQKQRVAIARALATQPDILLCDEATSALDPASTYAILNLLKEINRTLGLTILLITHELEVIKKICDQVAVLEQGRVVEVNTVVELFANPQQAITQQLIQQALHIGLPPSLQEKLQTHPAANTSLIVRFTFLGKDSDEPIIATLVKKFAVMISILHADIEMIQDTTVGFTVCRVEGEQAAIQQALHYAQSLSIKTEVLGYV